MDWYSEGAPRNLSADQFISVKNLTRMPNIDNYRKGPVDVGDKLFDMRNYPDRAKNMLSHHIQRGTIDPVHVGHPEKIAEDYYGTSAHLVMRDSPSFQESPLALGNGGHRTALATQFKGVHRLPVTPDRSVSDTHKTDMWKAKRDKSRLARMAGKRYPPPSASLGSALKRYGNGNP